jgi:competence protein ComEA
MNITSIKKLLSIFILSITILGFSSSAFSATESLSAFVEILPEKPMVVGRELNINKVSAEEISSHLKGIGLKKAEAIIEWRKANGEFTTLEQLMELVKKH